MSIRNLYTTELKFIFLIIFHFFILEILQSSNNFFLKKISIEDGLSNLSVLSIYQDILGRMWFGTNEGVNLYDGSKVISYKSYLDKNSKEEIFINGYVNQIIGDSIGNIFMRNNGRLVKYNIYNESFKSFSYHIDALENLNNEIWCSIRDSLFRYNQQKETFEFVHCFNIPQILCMVNKKSYLWLGTKDGLYLSKNDTIECILPNVEIFKLFYSSNNELWIATRRNGLYKININDSLIKATISSSCVISEEIRSIIEDDDQNIWFGTFEGLQSYNTKSNKYSLFTPTDDIGGLSHKSIFSLFKDKQGTIWVGTYYGGVNYFNSKKDIFKYYTYKDNSQYNLNFPIVGNFLEDPDGYIWICSDGGGINKLDRKTGKFTFYTENIKNTILHNNVKSIVYDKNYNNIYIGTYKGGLCRYEFKNKKFYNYLNDYNLTGIGPNSIIYSLDIKDDWLYISAQNGLWKYNLTNCTFSKIYSNKKFINIKIDSYGYIWLATNYSLYKSHINDTENLQLIPLGNSIENKTKITSIYEASDKTIYITTLGNGIYSYNNKNNVWKQYNTCNNNLLSNYCYNIIETSANNLLITSDTGLSIFSTQNEKILNSVRFSLKGGISSVTEGCGLLITKDKTILVGGIDGMIAFKEDDFLSKKDSEISFYFSVLFINDKKIVPNDNSNILSSSLPFTKKIDLKYNQNNIEIEFFFSNSVELEKNIKYQYKLEGFDNDWKSTVLMRLTYTNLSPGKYKLRLREINTPSKEIFLDIYIREPWFLNTWAYTLYILAFISISYTILKVSKNRRNLTLSLIKEKEEKANIEKINMIKFRFFTNVSHEFRTPLTLIITQIDLLLQSNNFSISIMRRLNNIRNNALKLKLLTNELLDYRRLSQAGFNLKIEYVNFIEYINDIYLSFKDIAQKDHINYTFEHIENSIGVWIDPIQFQKVVLNLLSNAFNYTDTGGQINIIITKQNNTVELIIKDTGCGISNVDSKRIFERFYQIEKNSSDKHIEGSGIGLALTKEIVEAHKGEISLDSQIGEGSSFKVTLLLGNEHYGKTNHNNSFIKIKEQLDSEIELFSSILKDKLKNETEKNVNNNNNSLSVLIVEKDKELMRVLEDVFSNFYEVHKAENGLEGWNKAKELHPNIVICEVYLSGMSGKELCHKIKNNIDTSYIPVVLITAQPSTECEIESYSIGADEYIIKPFDIRLLLAKCCKLIKNQERTNEPNSNEDKVNNMLIINENNRKLHDNIIQIIKKNFDNHDFDMDALASELKISRSSMFMRFKELFNMTPNELTLKLKLEEAMRMLKEEYNCNISEISYKLGFNSPQYFSRIFKSTYGVSPQSFRKMNKKQE